MISVIIPVFNNARFLRQAVLSVTGQSRVTAEIIVVDDGSTDESIQTLSDLADVTILRLEKNQGAAAAQNAGLKIASREWVTFLDSDDQMAPHSLAWREEWAKINSDQNIVAGLPAGILDEAGCLLQDFSQGLPVTDVPERLTADFYRSGHHFPVASWLYLFRKKFLQKLGGFNEKLRIAYDYDLLLRALDVTEIPVVHKPTVYRRVHSQNISVIQREGKLELRPETIEECLSILQPRGMVPPTDWIPWEVALKKS